MKRFFVFILGVLQNPFSFWLNVEEPKLPDDFGKSNLDSTSLLETHREEIIDSIKKGIIQKSEMHNETITQIRSLKLNIFIAGGAFLGILLGFSITNQITFTPIQSFSAWLLLFGIILGPISILLDWNFEDARINQAYHNEQLAWMLLINGDHDEYAKELLKKNIDDLLKIPNWMFWFYYINEIISSFLIIAFIIATILLSTNILLQRTDQENYLKQESYQTCISCPKQSQTTLLKTRTTLLEIAE